MRFCKVLTNSITIYPKPIQVTCFQMPLHSGSAQAPVQTRPTVRSVPRRWAEGPQKQQWARESLDWPLARRARWARSADRADGSRSALCSTSSSPEEHSRVSPLHTPGTWLQSFKSLGTPRHTDTGTISERTPTALKQSGKPQSGSQVSPHTIPHHSEP